MAYKVLYRKYRPATFQEVIGEESITENLKLSIKEKTFSHAYIFTGPRGTGKTSTAKILAKAINCTNSKDGEPCGECDSCKNFKTTPDIIEIDAASNNGVDEIRELRNNVTLAPSSSNYKIYIIDEVHMLTTGAFNALLKTLEEPPSHAIFILATTEIYKVPITILSRCQRFDFTKINRSQMIDYLKNISDKEEITYKEEAFEEIYELSDGCLRDALSILDQLSKAQKEITSDSVLQEYNIISNQTIEELLSSLIKGEVQKIIDTISNFEDSGMNAQKIIKKMINYLDKVALEIKLKKEKKYNFNTVDKLIKELNQCYIDARINKNVFSLIKLSFLELIDDPITSKKEAKTVQETQPAEQKEIDKRPRSTPKPMTLKDIRINNCFVQASKQDLNDLITLWKGIDQKQITSINIKDYTPVAASPKNAIFTCEESSLTDLFNIKHNEIEKLLKKLKANIKIIAITKEEWDKEKDKYKLNIKNKQEYIYIDEPKIIDDKDLIKGQMENIFTEKLIEIN